MFFDWLFFSGNLVSYYIYMGWRYTHTHIWLLGIKFFFSSFQCLCIVIVMQHTKMKIVYEKSPFIVKSRIIMNKKSLFLISCCFWSSSVPLGSFLPPRTVTFFIMLRNIKENSFFAAHFLYYDYFTNHRMRMLFRFIDKRHGGFEWLNVGCERKKNCPLFILLFFVLAFYLFCIVFISFFVSVFFHANFFFHSSSYLAVTKLF